MHDSQPPEMTDEQLVAAYRRDRQRECLERLLGRHLGRVRGMIFGMVLDHGDADDVMQEVFLRAIRGLAGFDGRSRFSTWLYRIALNTTRRFLERRGRSRERVETELFESLGSQQQAPDRRVMDDELSGQIAAGLASLSPALRAAISMVKLEGMSIEEAAEIEGCATATIYWRIHEARRLLKERLNRYLSP